MNLTDTVINGDCKKVMSEIPNAYYNIIYTDVPYNMNSRYTIDSSGHYRFRRKGSDFMNQWEAMDGIWWYEWFKEAYRILKPGGFLITHNIDRQADLWTYYARRSGFFPMQKLYWLFVDSFPKGVDLALHLDNTLGVEREIIGQKKGAQAESTGKYGSWGKNSLNDGIRSRLNKDQKMVHHNYLKGKMSVYDKTVATSELAKKYDGYKFGQAPFKQIMEEILVFYKEYGDSESVAKKVIRYENSPTKDIHPPVFNIGGTMVKPKKSFSKPRRDDERWTPQLLVHKEIIEYMTDGMSLENAADLVDPLPIIQYTEKDDALYRFSRKPNVAEREAGLDEFEAMTDNESRKNIHPTPKPLDLCRWVIKLFKLPGGEQMNLLDPFCGQGSILVAADEMPDINWTGIEINEQYHKLALAKLKHYSNKDKTFFD